MRKDTFGVDVDEVLADYLNPFILWHNHCYGTTLTFEDITEWDLFNVLKIDPLEERRRLMRFETPLNMLSLPPVQGSVEAIETLSREYRLVAVTSRGNSQRDITHLWLTQWFPQKFDEVLFTDHDMTSRPRYTKPELLENANAVLHIDDSVTHCNACRMANIPVLLFGNFPYNRGETTLPRANTWPDALASLRQWGYLRAA